MKRFPVLLSLITFFVACKNNNTPEVSGIPVNSRIERFDQFLFREVDTSNMPAAITRMNTAYPFFGNAFMEYILGLPSLAGNGLNDSTGQAAVAEFKRFLRLTRPLYDSIAPKYSDVSDLEQELKEAFQYVKYYFPAYKVPKLVTYIGPFDTPGVAVTSDAMAIGLQLFAGKDFS
ncbi:MAG: hypothetical protein H7Y03_07255, partial [Chitinophagaceae bacterium]|nr:hypothetical protein [Chitinophagaceae bacterium]